VNWISLILFVNISMAHTPPKTMPTPAAAQQRSNQQSTSKQNSTNMNFDDLLIQGQYHFSDEAVITVEQDKALDALLGVRKDFKDRLEQSASRR
jgi:hypothetical protein